ncbi:uncharacterized protein ColSpa_11271 [Colletotrichum spaethianum]|uniref:Uncharacterized protein n=1 Tax=Colletotrichum spaethianum TaxID=700344 RepID=A0AA37UPN3_9PEZI|nr:uncharacterized protein ColSpa_11271 [Colletotrichum spaethianum]GKT51090.1 hypothetical protein ColSpa_11271 [Colletotrichum spaethianum]
MYQGVLFNRSLGSTAPKPNATITAPSATGSPTYYKTATPTNPTQSSTISQYSAYYLITPSNNCFIRPSADGTWLRGVTCQGTAFSDYCLPFGFCGSRPKYYGGNNDDDDGGGGGRSKTEDGTYSPDYGKTMCTPQFGGYCSIYGFYRSRSDFCAPRNYHSGNYKPNVDSPSTNRECRPNNAGNKTCTRTQFRACCSVHGFCGDRDNYYKGLAVIAAPVSPGYIV